MSIGFDPLVGSLLFAAGLVPHAAKPKAQLELASKEMETVPFVTIIVALYREKWDDIAMTMRSLRNQTYPKDKLEILLVAEADDASIQPSLRSACIELEAAGFNARIVISNGGRRLKAYALNQAIEQARGKYCVFYDASDDIEDSQILRAISLMEENNYDAVQSTVLRKGKSLLSEFLLIDTVFWFRKYLPFVLSLSKGMPLSGEGLFLKTETLREVGGFPEVLTEDAYLGILLAEKNKRFGLVSSVITEKAPRNIRSHFVQRLRWNRGYLTCLARLLRSSMPLKRKSVFLLPFLTPISCSLAFLGWILIVLQWILSRFEVSAVLQLNAATWLFLVGIPICVASYVHTLWRLGLKRYVPFVVLLPYYWTFIGFAATCSFFKSTKHWGRTER